MPKFKVTFKGKEDTVQEREVTSEIVVTGEHYVTFSSGSGMNSRIQLVIPRSSLISVEESK